MLRRICMKKLFVLLLSLVVVGGIFAQATVNGYVRAIGTYTESGFAYADRLRLNLNFKTEDGNAQAFSRLQVSNAVKTVLNSATLTVPTVGDPTLATGTTTVTDLGVSYLWGSAKLFDGKVKITGGKLGNWDYEPISSGVSNYQLGNVNNDFDFIDGDKGFLVQAYPVEGLNIGLMMVPNADVTAGDFAAAAMYTIKDVGDAVVVGLLADDSAATQISAAFNFTGVENLSAGAGYKYKKDAGSAFALIDYTMGDLSVQVAPEYFLAKDTGLYVEGAVSYTMGDAVFHVLGAYDQGKSNLDGKYLFGVEALYNVSKKGQLEADFYYDDVNSYSVKTTVKVSF